MSIMPTASTGLPGLDLVNAPAAPRVRRVRHQARETLALMAFSAGTSVAFASVLLLMVSLGR